MLSFTYTVVLKVTFCRRSVFCTKFLLWLPSHSAEFCIIQKMQMQMQTQTQTTVNDEGVESVEWHS